MSGASSLNVKVSIKNKYFTRITLVIYNMYNIFYNILILKYYRLKSLINIEY